MKTSEVCSFNGHFPGQSY